MENLLDKSLPEIEQIFSSLKIAAYKAKETFRSMHKGLKASVSDITILKKEERDVLSKKFEIYYPQVKKEQKDGDTKKVSLELKDKLAIETVLMQYEGERNTVCVSSQVGCPVGCKFCATGRGGFKRNLTVGEILAQVYYFARSGKISNVVFMGMGEPFFNYDNVLAAARALNHKLGQNIAARKIVFSTIGVAAGIKKLSLEPEQFRLAWSLVAPNDNLRRELVGLDSLPSINDILFAVRDYQAVTKRRVTIEYVLLDGINDSDAAADQVAHIAHRFDSNVNVIPYNAAAGARFTAGDAVLFQKKLEERKVNAVVRRSFGKKISAACGQLSSRP